MKPTAEDRFWAKVVKTPGCWLWNAARDSRGYGNFYAYGRYHKASRFALEISCGPLSPGQEAAHRCDNPPCVRPDHLFAATSRENTRDRIAKGRPGSPGPKNASRGEGRWSAKLTADDVREMRRLYEAGGVSQQQLADRYGIGQVHVGRIVNRQRWRHVE